MDFDSPAANVLSGVLCQGMPGLDLVFRSVEESHFPDQVSKNLFLMLRRYAEVTGGVLTAAALADLLESVDAGKRALYVETFATLATKEVTVPELKWAVQRLKDAKATELTTAALVKGMEILRGVTVVDSEDPVHQIARTEVMTALVEVETLGRLQDAPEGDLSDEASEMLSDYAQRKVSARTSGIGWGVAELDSKTGGVQPGELALIAGYSSDGKSSLCVQLAWAAAVQQGKNVAFMTTETLRPQVRRKLIARHSMISEFGLPDGLNTRDLKAGSLTEEQEAVFERVVADFTSNPTYGTVYLAQVPRGATLSTVERRLYQINRSFQIDLVVIDYLALLRADRKRTSDREELGFIIKEAKQMATTFDDGRGVAVVSPWQVNRASRDQAEKVGYYASSALAETAEATNSSDLIVSILASATDTRHAEVRSQILKNRDGETASSIVLSVDYATCTFRSTNTEGSLDYLVESLD